MVPDVIVVGDIGWIGVGLSTVMSRGVVIRCMPGLGGVITSIVLIILIIGAVPWPIIIIMVGVGPPITKVVGLVGAIVGIHDAGLRIVINLR